MQDLSKNIGNRFSLVVESIGCETLRAHHASGNLAKCDKPLLDCAADLGISLFGQDAGLIVCGDIFDDQSSDSHSACVDKILPGSDWVQHRWAIRQALVAILSPWVDVQILQVPAIRVLVVKNHLRVTILTQARAILSLTSANRSKLHSREIVILRNSVTWAIHVFVVHIGKSLPDILDLSPSTCMVDSIIKHHD
jgi:hypothetical protein